MSVIAISSRDNPHIKAAVRLRDSVAGRCAPGRFFLEGFRLCADALASGYAPAQVFLTQAARGKYLTAPLEQAAAQVFEITGAVAEKLGDTRHPQGVFGVFEVHEARPGDFWRAGGRYVALEGVQDPGNLGAVARTAQALGIAGLLVSGGCDIFHPKALRASMGALLRLPAMRAGDLPAALRACGLPCYAAVPDREARPVLHCDFTQGGVIVIGSEAHGLSDEAVNACACKITVPMPGGAESLNAAAAAIILMWEMARQTSDFRH
ncbi:MAG: RNA methyltransferase [Oscillospiraceae bacterium]|nr:RNA methyltransferase [Oscillospiraceae bacterium]